MGNRPVFYRFFAATLALGSSPLSPRRGSSPSPPGEIVNFLLVFRFSGKAELKVREVFRGLPCVLFGLFSFFLVQARPPDRGAFKIHGGWRQWVLQNGLKEQPLSLFSNWCLRSRGSSMFRRRQLGSIVERPSLSYASSSSSLSTPTMHALFLPS